MASVSYTHLLQAALRRRNALRSKKGATPAAAAAAAVAAVPVEEYHWYNADAVGDDEAEGFEPRLVSCGRARFGMKDYGVADGWGEDFAGDADDAVAVSYTHLDVYKRQDMVDLADRADVTLACDIEPLAHDRVLVDAVRLSHVLTQLVDNAIKYSPAGSTVRISVAENAGAPQGFASFRFVVADKGVGMEPAFMERMFMPFERESNTTASGVQGTGLGLTIVRNVLDLMEGELAVESAPGEGSTFTVDITCLLYTSRCV